jgi:hypothetical protein
MRDLNIRSPLEKFAVPHQFQPRLSLSGALVAVTGALARILLGCLIAALWGVWIWLTAVSPHSIFWKGAAILALAAGLAASLAALLWAISALVNYLTPSSPTST